MRSVVSGFLFLLLLSSPFTGQTTEWKRYKNTDGSFTVLFPGDPESSISKNDNGAQSHTLTARENPVMYMVVYTTHASLQPVNEATYQDFKNAFFKELPKCEGGAEEPASPAVEGYIGHWYRLNCEIASNKIRVAGNLYWGEHNAFAVVAVFPVSVAEPAGVKKFVESFAVIDRAK